MKENTLVFKLSTTPKTQKLDRTCRGSISSSYSLKESYNFKRNEPPHDKTNKMTCAPSEDSEQPGHLPNLIRVFAMRSMGSLGPKISSCEQRRLIRLGVCPGYSESSMGAHFAGFVVRRLKYDGAHFDNGQVNFQFSREVV